VLTIDHPIVMEIARIAGFDWLWVDAEHGRFNETTAALCSAINAGGPPVFVRLPDHTPTTIKRYLDAGCDGIILPQVSAVEDVDSIARAALYPPRGQRSVGIARAQAYGARFAESIREQDYVILVQIETVAGVQNAEAIIGHDAVDGVLVGPYDLSGSFGNPGQVDAPNVTDAIATVKRIADSAGKPCGIFATNAEKARAYAEAGFSFIGAGIDSNILLNAYKELQQAFSA
jgi:2-keto-3-deoxy-L-rhamnonate aldolase RhmA